LTTRSLCWKLLRDYQQASQNLERVPDNIDYQTESARLSTEMDQSGGWAAEANAKAVLTRLGIPYFDTQIATLSGGQRKRVALARALIDRADLPMIATSWIGWSIGSQSWTAASW